MTTKCIGIHIKRLISRSMVTMHQRIGNPPFPWSFLEVHILPQVGQFLALED